MAPAVAGIAAFPLLPVAPLPADRFPDRPGRDAASGSKPRNHGCNRGAAARAPVCSNLRSDGHDVDEHARRNLDRSAIRSRPQLRCRGANRQLPSHLSSPPTYRKVNPADSLILVIVAYSDTLPITTVDDFGPMPLSRFRRSRGDASRDRGRAEAGGAPSVRPCKTAHASRSRTHAPRLRVQPRTVPRPENAARAGR